MFETYLGILNDVSPPKNLAAVITLLWVVSVKPSNVPLSSSGKDNVANGVSTGSNPVEGIILLWVISPP